jgi:hypothetical protein
MNIKNQTTVFFTDGLAITTSPSPGELLGKQNVSKGYLQYCIFSF